MAIQMNSNNISRKRPLVLAVIVTFLVLGMAIFVLSTQLSIIPCNLHSSREPISPVKKSSLIRIVAPENCQTDLPTLPDYTLVTGTYSSEITDQALWILVFSADGRYSPQGNSRKLEDGTCTGSTFVIEGGKWTIPIYPGRPMVKEQFDIVLVSTQLDGVADETFKNWLISGCQTSQYVGFTKNELPDGLVEIDSVTIHTR